MPSSSNDDEGEGPSSSTTPTRPTPQPPPEPPEQCFSSHHDFHSRTQSIRIQITDSKTLLPNPSPCIPPTIPSRYSHILRNRITQERWTTFANDVNGEVEEWRIQARGVQRSTRISMAMWLLTSLSSVPLLIHVLLRHDKENMYPYRIGAIALLSLSAICLLGSVIMVYRGASLERSARSDLIAVLDWHTDETAEDEDEDGVCFELIRARMRRRRRRRSGLGSGGGGGGDEDGDNGGGGSGGGNGSGSGNGEHDDNAGAPPSPSWVPVYHYYIKIVVKSDDANDEERGGRGGGEGMSSSLLCSDTSRDDDEDDGEEGRPRKEESQKEESLAVEEDDNETDNAVMAGTLQEPLLTSAERKSAAGTTYD